MKKITVLEFKSKLKKAKVKAIAESVQVNFSCGGGLTVIVQKGTASANFFARAKTNGKTVWRKLGNAEKMELATAFKAAEKNKSDIKEVQSDIQRAPLFREFFKNWIEHYFPTISPSRQANVKSLYNTVLKHLDRFHLDDLSVILVNRVLEPLKTSQSNKRTALKSLKQSLDYAQNMGLISYNPIQNIMKLPQWHKEKTEGFKWCRAEDLNVSFFKPLGQEPLMCRVYYLLIALTASRKTEMRYLQRDWINTQPKADAPNGVITVPAAFTKTKKADHVIPITAQIKALLDFWLPQIPGDTPFIFYSNIERNRQRAPVCANSLDYGVTRLVSKNCTLHGLRKSFRSFMSEHMKEGFSDIAIELCLAHDIRSDVRLSYDKYGYLREKYEALAYWDNYIQSVLEPGFIEL